MSKTYSHFDIISNGFDYIHVENVESWAVYIRDPETGLIACGRHSRNNNNGEEKIWVDDDARWMTDSEYYGYDDDNEEEVYTEDDVYIENEYYGYDRDIEADCDDEDLIDEDNFR